MMELMNQFCDEMLFNRDLHHLDLYQISDYDYSDDHISLKNYDFSKDGPLKSKAQTKIAYRLRYIKDLYNTQDILDS